MSNTYLPPQENTQPLGSMLIIAAPSGGGKTSLVRSVIEKLDKIELSISYTTRPKRPGEQNGVDYFFVTEAEFLAMINSKSFIEHAVVFNHHYGTAFHQVMSRMQAGIDIILEIDWQGARQIKEIFKTAKSIFIVPPSLRVLKQRLLNRQQDAKNVIKERMLRAKAELSHFAEFEYLIVNDDFAKAAFELQSIILANRLITVKQSIQQRQLLSLLLS